MNWTTIAGFLVGVAVGYSALFWTPPEDQFVRAKPGSVHLWQYNSFGGWSRVAVVYGYVDDYDGCRQMAEALKKKFYASEYRCEETQ